MWWDGGDTRRVTRRGPRWDQFSLLAETIGLFGGRGGRLTHLLCPFLVFGSKSTFCLSNDHFAPKLTMDPRKVQQHVALSNSNARANR